MAFSDPTITTRSARRRILETAGELFYREGIRAVGVDTIIARSGVAKMSLYRNFASKDELVCAWLEEIRGFFWRWWDKVAARHPGDPREQMKALFRSMEHWCADPRFRGCPFINTAVEYRTAGHPGLTIVDEHRRQVVQRFTELGRAAGAGDPAGLAARLLLVMDGAYAIGDRTDGIAPAVAATAAVLIDAAIPTVTPPPEPAPAPTPSG